MVILPWGYQGPSSRASTYFPFPRIQIFQAPSSRHSQQAHPHFRELSLDLQFPYFASFSLY